jgi:hypothetical protein
MGVFGYLRFQAGSIFTLLGTARDTVLTFRDTHEREIKGPVRGRTSEMYSGSSRHKTQRSPRKGIKSTADPLQLVSHY